MGSISGNPEIVGASTKSGSSASGVVRVGSVPYLNAKVLVWGLSGKGKGYSLELEPPSVLAKRLRVGSIDVGLVSSIEYFLYPGYRILPGMGICGREQMWSVKLFHRAPLDKLRRVGLDPASGTTNALLKILLAEYLKSEAEVVPVGMDEDPVTREDLDGFLKIGDPCLTFSTPGYSSFDLLGAWTELTGLPFVFAMWLVREGVDLQGVENDLARARQEGFQHADRIAEAYSSMMQISRERALEYVTKIIRYDLGEQELAGLAKFQSYLLGHRIIEGVRSLRYYSSR